MERPGRNDPCHCGSGKKYKRCHYDVDRELDREAPRSLAEVMPELEAKMAKEREVDRRLRDEYGVHINYVRPIQWKGGKVWAIGSRVYLGRPPNETFHEFILAVLRDTLGEEWRSEQAAMPEEARHFVMRCFDELAKFKAERLDRERLEREGVVSAEPNGWVTYLMSLAWDVATLIHAGGLPDALVRRLRSTDQYQGARYEMAIAAIFARLDCEIRFLDEDEELRGVKHVEFEATHRPTGQVIAVEAKSRHRRGILNQPGEPDDDPLRSDARAVRTLFVKATEKAPPGLPFFVFIDMNAPLTAEIDARWKSEVQNWMNRLPAPTAERPDVYNALYVTNFSPHYAGDDISTGSSWLQVIPLYVHAPLNADLWPALGSALDTYGRVPPISEDGLLD